MTCEIVDESAIEVDEEHAVEERDLEEAAAGVRYKHALCASSREKAAFPNELCG